MTGSTKYRVEIEKAMEHLLSGRPLRSTGDLTVVQLAEEAGVKRWRLTHQHVDLTRRFQNEVATRDGKSPLLAPLRDEVARLKVELTGLRSKNSDLEERLSTYARVIDDLHVALTVERSVKTNVTALPRNSR